MKFKLITYLRSPMLPVNFWNHPNPLIPIQPPKHPKSYTKASKNHQQRTGWNLVLKSRIYSWITNLNNILTMQNEPLPLEVLNGLISMGRGATHHRFGQKCTKIIPSTIQTISMKWDLNLAKKWGWKWAKIKPAGSFSCWEGRRNELGLVLPYINFFFFFFEDLQVCPWNLSIRLLRPPKGFSGHRNESCSTWKFHEIIFSF